MTKNRTAMTLMCWILGRVWNAGAVNNKLVGYSTGTSAVNSRINMITRGAAPGQVQVGGRALDTDGQRTLDSTTTLATNVWHHVAGILDYATNFGYIYINGELDIAGTLSAAFGATQTENTNTLSVGMLTREGASAGQAINGLIDDVRLYNGILGPATIKSIYTARGADGIVSGLLHRYPFNDLAPGTAVVGVSCIGPDERIVGLPIGAPVFAAGITTPKRRGRRSVGNRR